VQGARGPGGLAGRGEDRHPEFQPEVTQSQRGESGRDRAHVWGPLESPPHPLLSWRPPEVSLSPEERGGVWTPRVLMARWPLLGSLLPCLGEGG
jgi:hypothetical protein